MFGYKKRIKDLETKVTRQGYDIISLTKERDRLNAKFNCFKGNHKYELNNVGVGEGVERRDEFGSRWTHYDKYHPAKVCKHCDDTINLEEVKED